MASQTLGLENPLPAPPSPFKDGVQYAFDATTLKLIEACEYKYFLRTFGRWTRKDKSVHLRFGGLYATALEHYYKLVANGATSNEALVAVVWEALEATWDYSCHTCKGTGQVETDKEEARKALGFLGGTIDWATTDCSTCEGSGKDPNGGAPVPFDDPAKTRENLIRTIVWYVDQFENEEIKVMILANGKPALEYSFALPVENGVVFTGHIDRLVMYSDAPYVMDQKTTAQTIGPYYWNQFSPDTQMSMYTFAGKIIYDLPVKGVIIDAAEIKVGFSRFSRGFTFRSQGQLNEWYDDSMAHIENIQRATRKGHFPKRTTSCYLCEFREVCDQDPSVRNNVLRGDFIQGEQWNPLKPR
jgi:hypothetical protein